MDKQRMCYRSRFACVLAPGQARAPRDCNCQDSNNEMMGNGLAGDLNNGMDTSK